MAHKHICLPFESEAHYRSCLENLTQYRAYLMKTLTQHPEIFPQAMAAGFSFHSTYHSRKQKELVLRRIKLKRTGSVLTLRPCFVMPYLVARTEEVEKALFLRQWDVPFSALAYVFGRDAMFWYRAWLAMGRPSLVGTTVKTCARMPEHLVADEKITWLAGTEVCIPTTAGGGCVLGISMAASEESTALKAGYGEFAREAAAVFPNYQPQSVCTDGFRATRQAWRELFPQITLVLCFLHSILKIAKRCRGTLRYEVPRSCVGCLACDEQARVCTARPAAAGVVAAALERGGHGDGREAVRQVCGLLARVWVSGSGAHLECGGSAAQCSGSALVCNAILSRNTRECTFGGACAGDAVELSPLRLALAL